MKEVSSSEEEQKMDEKENQIQNRKKREQNNKIMCSCIDASIHNSFVLRFCALINFSIGYSLYLVFNAKTTFCLLLQIAQRTNALKKIETTESYTSRKQCKEIKSEISFT